MQISKELREKIDKHPDRERFLEAWEVIEPYLLDAVKETPKGIRTITVGKIEIMTKLPLGNEVVFMLSELVRKYGTPEKLAVELGICYETLKAYKTGKRNPKVETLERIKEFYLEFEEESE